MYEWIREISDLHLPLHFSSEWFILPCCVTQIYHLFCVLLGLFQNLATLWFSAFYRETSFCLYVNAEVYARHCDFTSCSYLFLCAECRIRDGSYVRTTPRKAFFQWIVSPVWLACGTQLFLGNFLEHFFFCGLHWSKSCCDWLSARQVFLLPERTFFPAPAKSKYNKTARLPYFFLPSSLLCCLFNFWHNKESLFT